MTDTPPRTLKLDQFRGAAALIMFSVLASRGIGFVREMYIAAAFGAGANTDAYNIAFRIPDLLNYLAAGGALSITFIPILGALMERKEDDEAHRVLSTVVTFMGLLLLAGTILGEVFAPQILHWYAGDFSPDQMQLSLTMTRILLPGPFCFCMGGLLAATLYTRGSFWIPAMTPLIYNLGTLVGGVLLGRRYGITSLAIGTVAGAFLGPFLLSLVGAVRTGMRYRPRMDLGNPHFQRWLVTTIPLMIGVSIVTVDDWIIGHLANYSAGAVSHLNYAKRLTAVPIAVLGQAVGQAAMPFFSRLVNQGNWKQFHETVDRSVTRSVIGGIFCVSLLEVLALPGVRFAYEHGKFHDVDAHVTASYFSIFMLTLVFWIIQGIYARAFYATGNTLAPMVQSTIVTLVTLPIYYLFLQSFGIVGLAWASNAAIMIQTLSLAALLRWKGLLVPDKERWAEVGRALVAGLVAWMAAALVFRWLEIPEYKSIHEIAVTLAVCAVWTVTVAILTPVFKLTEVRQEASRLLAKLNRFRG